MAVFDNDIPWRGYPSLETLYLNNVDISHEYKEMLSLSVFTYSMSFHLHNLRKLYLKDNDFKSLNVEFHFRSLHLIDLSKNVLEYIAPGVFEGSVSLIDVSLYDNKLYVMENFKDFKNLFISLKKLLKINMARNGLSVIPDGMFDKNINLENIDLSFNKLTFVSSSFTNLKKLQRLDLSNNRILLSNEEFSLVSEYLEARFLSLDDKFLFNLSGNSFVCSCQENRVLRWIYVHLSGRLQDKDQLQCILNGKKETITERIVLETQQMCFRHKAIIVSVLILTACVLGVMTTVICFMKRFLRRRRREEQINRFIKRFKENKLIKYFAFLIFCQKDLEFIRESLPPALTEILEDHLKLNQTLVCEGFNAYRLGLPLINEADRCIRESSVTIFLVSRASCACQRCKWELKLAVDNNKPIITVFKEEVDNDKLPDMLHIVVRGGTCAHFIRKRDTLVLRPEPRKFCQTLLAIAAAHEENNVNG